MLYEGLFRSSQKGNLEYGICESVKISSCKKTYVFKLKKAYWSDGSLITAEDFKNTWLQQLDPDFPSPYCYLFYSIKNAKNFKKNRCHQEDVGIKVLGTNLLQIELDSPRDDLLDLLSFSCFHPYKQRDGKALFNGPFSLVSHKPHESLLLEANNYYHDYQLVDIKRLFIRILDSEATAFAMFNQGELDIIGGPLSSIPQEERFKRKSPIIQQMAGSTLCAFNTQSRYFKNLNLRKAFAYAIDQAALEKIAQTSHSHFHFLPIAHRPKNVKNQFGSRINEAQVYLEKALKELNIDKKDLNNLCYYYGAKPDHAKIAQVLHRFWKTNLGIDVQLTKLEHKVLASKISNKNFDFAQLVWLSAYDSPLALLDRFKDANLAKNFSSFYHPELDILIKKLENGFQNKELIIDSIENIFEQHMPFIPVNDWKYPYYTSSKIEKLCFTNLGTLNFTFIKINKDTCSLPPSSGI